jgi:hypothetical protein
MWEGGRVGGCVCVQAARLVDPHCLYAYFYTSKASKLITCHMHIGVDVPPNTAAAQSYLQGTQFTCFTGTSVSYLQGTQFTCSKLSPRYSVYLLYWYNRCGSSKTLSTVSSLIALLYLLYWYKSTNTDADAAPARLFLPSPPSSP